MKLRILASPSRPGRHLQAGMSMVELMVGITIGMFVVAAAAMLVGYQLTDNRRLLLETQLQQDLRSTADIITRELRRAGYSNNPENAVWAPGIAPTPNTYSGVTTPSTSEIRFKYRRGAFQDGPYGFRLNSTTHSLETNLGVNGVTDNWQEFTDARVMQITSFAIDSTPEPEVILPCAKLCSDGTTDCWPRHSVREYVLTIAARSSSDSTVTRQLSTNVRLRNDLVRFVDAAQICPP